MGSYWYLFQIKNKFNKEWIKIGNLWYELKNASKEKINCAYFWFYWGDDKKKSRSKKTWDVLNVKNLCMTKTVIKFQLMVEIRLDNTSFWNQGYTRFYYCIEWHFCWMNYEKRSFFCLWCRISPSSSSVSKRIKYLPVQIKNNNFYFTVLLHMAVRSNMHWMPFQSPFQSVDHFEWQPTLVKHFPSA